METDRPVVGWMLVGWGLFNLVEGTVDHHVLGIHHVRETGNHIAWDLGFLAFGALLVLGGWLLARSAVPATTASSRSRRPISGA